MRLREEMADQLRALADSNKLAPTDRPDLGYAMIFPGMTFVKILFVDIVPALL
jgi:putative transport protein